MEQIFLTFIKSTPIEIKNLKKPIGVQDQYIAAYGGLRYFKFHRSGQITSEKLILNESLLKELNNKLILFFTGKTRKSEDILKEQKANIKSKFKILNKTMQL